jgi:hypothetical protein
LRRVERWIFASGSGRRLAAIRIGLCSILAFRLNRGLYLDMAGQPKALYRPLSFMHLFGSMPSRGVAQTVQVAGVTLAFSLPPASSDGSHSLVPGLAGSS